NTREQESHATNRKIGCLTPILVFEAREWLRHSDARQVFDLPAPALLHSGSPTPVIDR
ncbi:MAG: hypothetical protein QOF72_3115, partial [Blastocatellia bacterium]|nr:hypothetical protein [Blastocatellia bacterium]